MNIEETERPWVAAGKTEEEFKNRTITYFLNDAREFGFELEGPNLAVAERRATYFKMEQVITMINQVKESLKIRREAYNEVLFKQHRNDFSYFDAKKAIDRFSGASQYQEFDTWRAAIDAINARIMAPQIQDTTMQTVTLQEKDDEEMCCVCLEVFIENETLPKCPGCKKCIHEHCMLKCLKTKHTCPHCRHNLIDHASAFQKMSYKAWD